jgi:uncharacterized protein YacL
VLHAFRVIFVGICMMLGLAIGLEQKHPWIGLASGALIGVSCVLLEWAFARRFIAVISTLMFGLIVGFVIAYFITTALNLVMPVEPSPAKTYRDFGIMFVTCFMAVLAILHTKDDFKFVIPFVELKRERGYGRPLVLDTSVIIDGRIADIVQTHIIDAPIIVPRFVLNELQAVADSSDRLKRNRGRRGLDVLNRMRERAGARIEVQDITLEHMEDVDQKLIRVAKLLDGRLVTNDFNLNKVATVQGVSVVNINELANALRSAVVQGERLRVRIVRTGDAAGQGVGYLEDGTMVVAEECAGRIGQEVDLTVTNVLQTNAGRLVFGRPAQRPTPEESAARSEQSSGR